MRFTDLSICALFVMTIEPIGRGVSVVCVTLRHLDMHTGNLWLSKEAVAKRKKMIEDGNVMVS